MVNSRSIAVSLLTCSLLGAVSVHAAFLEGTPCGGEYDGCINAAFVAEGRIGDTVTGAGEHTFEVDLAESTDGPFEPGETADTVWQSGIVTPFVLVYDAGAETVQFTVNGATVTHHTAITSPLDLILVRAVATETSRVVIGNLTLDFIPVGGELDVTYGVNVLVISRDMLEEGFTMTGDATLYFPSGPQSSPANAELAFQVKVGTACEPVPEPASLLMSIPGLAVLRRRRA